MKRYTVWTLIGTFFTILTLTALSVVNAFRPSEAEYANPFGEFATLMSGQPTAVLNQDRCNVQYNFDDQMETGFYCNLEPEDGPFRSIMITALEDEIAVVWFTVNNLQVGDLVHRWGRPDTVHHNPQEYILRWGDEIYATASASGWYSLGSQVKFVAIRQPSIDGEFTL